MSQSCRLLTTEMSEWQPLGRDTLTVPTKLTLRRCLHFNAILFIPEHRKLYL